MIGALWRFSILAISAAFLGSCQYSPDMTERALAYNGAVSDTSNQVLLLNIIRSSEHEPRYYTRLESNTATASVTPSLSLSLPIGKSKSRELDVGSGGFSGTKNVSMWAAVLSQLGLQATEANLVTLQSLDDQSYQNGQQNSVPVSVLKIYWDEGYQPDVLLLMSTSAITIKKSLLPMIDSAIKQRCDSDRRWIDSSFCRYVEKQGSQAFPDLPREKQNYQLAASVAQCGDDFGSTLWNYKTETDPAGSGSDGASVVFINDPAWEELLRNATKVHHSEACFEALMEDLVALGMAPTPAKASFTLAGTDVEQDLLKSPKYRSALLQAKIQYVPAFPDSLIEAERHSLLCSPKAAGDATFTLNLANPGPDATSASSSTAVDTIANGTPDPNSTGTYPSSDALVSTLENGLMTLDPAAFSAKKRKGAKDAIAVLRTALRNLEYLRPTGEDLDERKRAPIAQEQEKAKRRLDTLSSFAALLDLSNRDKYDNAIKQLRQIVYRAPSLGTKLDQLAAALQKKSASAAYGRVDVSAGIKRCQSYLASEEDKPASVAESVAVGKNISFTIRSFEGMVYYLGEVVRYEKDFDQASPDDRKKMARPVFVMERTLATRDRPLPEEPYLEPLFYASKNQGADARVTVDYNEATYGIPGQCHKLPDWANRPPDQICTTEYPDHESMPVIQLLNQIWGLEKQSTNAPGITVSAPQ